MDATARSAVASIVVHQNKEQILNFFQNIFSYTLVQWNNIIIMSKLINGF
jgi:hypothetical protein